MESEKHFRLMLESLNQTVFLIDENLTIIYSNKPRSPDPELPAGDIVGEKCYKVLHGFDKPCHHHRISLCPVTVSLETGEKTFATHKHFIENEIVVEEVVATPFNGIGYIVQELFNISRLLVLINGILPICSVCKRIRDLNGEWIQIEDYFHKHTGADFSHSLCIKCKHEMYPNLL